MLILSYAWRGTHYLLILIIVILILIDFSTIFLLSPPFLKANMKLQSIKKLKMKKSKHQQHYTFFKQKNKDYFEKILKI